MEASLEEIPLDFLDIKELNRAFMPFLRRMLSKHNEIFLEHTLTKKRVIPPENRTTPFGNNGLFFCWRWSIYAISNKKKLKNLLDNKRPGKSPIGILV